MSELILRAGVEGGVPPAGVQGEARSRRANRAGIKKRENLDYQIIPIKVGSGYSKRARYGFGYGLNTNLDIGCLTNMNFKKLNICRKDYNTLFNEEVRSNLNR